MNSKDFYLSYYSKRRGVKESPIKEVMESLFSLYHINVCFYEEELKEAWHKVVGELIFKMTMKFEVTNGCLYVKVSSAALKHELLMVRGSLLEKLQKQVPEAKLKNIYIQ